MRLTGFLSVKPSTPPRRLPITNRVRTRWIVSMGHGLTLKPFIKFCYRPQRTAWDWLPLDYDTILAYGFSFVKHKKRKNTLFSFVKMYKDGGGVLVKLTNHIILAPGPGNKSPRNDFFKPLLPPGVGFQYYQNLTST